MRLQSVLIVGLILLSFAGSIVYPVGQDLGERTSGSNSQPNELGTQSSTAPAAAQTRGSDTFVMASYSEPSSLDPAVDYETAGGELIQNMYETLVWYDGEHADRLVPMLATEVPTVGNGGISPDGLHYTFTLRQDVRFHDGTTMDAYDVEYSFERVLTINDINGPAWLLGKFMIPGYQAGVPLDPNAVANSVQVIDPYTVRINLAYQYTPFLQVLAGPVASVVSMEYIEAHGGAQANTINAWMINHESGTGPFVLKEWVPYQYVSMQRFDGYWRTPAKLKYVIIENVYDLGTREMMLFSGEADSIILPVGNRADVIGQPGVRIVEGQPTFTMNFVGFNLDIIPSASIDIGNISTSFFQDLNVRQAFVHAFNESKFLGDVILGGGIQPRGVIPSGMFGYNSSVPYQEFNLTKSAEFLNLSIDDRTGTSFGEEGFHLILYYNYGNLMRQGACELLKAGLESLSTLGLVQGHIIVDVQGLYWPDYSAAMTGRNLPIMVFGWAPDYSDPDDYTLPFYTENGYFAREINLQNLTLTQMCDDAAVELNATLRTKDYYNIEMVVYNNSYYLWLYEITNFHVERDWVKGYYYNPMYLNLYYYPLSVERPWADAPTNIKTTSTIDRIALNWDAPQWPGTSPITNYSVYRGMDPGGSKDYIGNTTGSTTAFVDRTIAFGMAYYYEVVAWNSYGEGLISDEASGPVIVNQPSDAVLNIDWSYQPISSQSIVVWHESTNASWLAFYPSIPFFDGTPTVTGSYWLNVSGVNGNGLTYLNYTINVYDVVPAAPQYLQAASGVDQISLSWYPPPYYGGSAITAYNIYRGTYSGGESYLTTIENQLSYTDTPLIAGMSFYYRVSAINAAGEGPQSNEASATVLTIPSAPQDLKAIPGVGFVALKWTAPADNGGSPITSYQIYRGTTSGGESYLTTVTGTSYIDFGLAGGMVYYYEVRAVNIVGPGLMSNHARATTPTEPYAPLNLKASGGSDQVTLTWASPGSDGGSDTTAYKIYRGTSPGAESYLTTVGGARLTFVDKSVTNGQVYYYKVSAVNDVGEGPKSNEASAKPMPENVPSAVQDFSASKSNGQVTLTWSAPKDNGGSAITGYRIYRGTASGQLSYLTTVTGITFTDTGLTNGQTYYYKVGPANGNGEGVLSSEVSADPVSGGGVSVSSGVLVAIGLVAVVGVLVAIVLIQRPGK